MGYLPELVDQNEDYLAGIRRGWREYNLIEFSSLMEELLLIQEELASQKRPMARKVFQILIEIMESIIKNHDKREILVSGFMTLVPSFPKIPTQHLISCYKEGHLSTTDYQMIIVSLVNAPDLASAIRIA